MLKLRLAAPEDPNAIMKLIGQTKAHLKKLGVDQWQDDYPDAVCIETLKGRWLRRQPYAVVHRLTIGDACKGRGLSGEMLPKNGFTYCGTVCFHNSEKIAFEKLI